jgi:ABC-type multidrug transport system fused ATPase/permease subunit
MLQPEDVRIDNESQLILHGLRGGEWVRALKLRRAAGLDENRQVFYRMEKHLIPGGLVEEQERESSDEMRLFRLTSLGAEWVEERGRELEMPTTREQVQKYALEGYEAGTSAKESVQDYRKKLHRLKRRVERTEDDIAEVEDGQRESDKDVEYLRERSQAIRMRSIGNNNRLDSLEDDVEERATIERVDEVRDDVSGAERRLTTVEDKQVGLAREQAEAARTRARLRRLVKPAGYVAVGAVAAYLVVLVAVFLFTPGLLTSVLIGGIAGALGVAVGTAVSVYVRGIIQLQL